MNYSVRSPHLPLAVYREVAAHLQLVEGVQTRLSSQTAPFDYALSQIDRLWIDYPDTLTPAQRQQVEQILTYYGDRYGSWQHD